MVLPASTPPLNLKKTIPQVRRLLRQMQQLETARSYTSARNLLLEDDSPIFLSQVWDSSGEELSSDYYTVICYEK